MSPAQSAFRRNDSHRVGRLLNPDRRLRLPPGAEMRPHPQFLRYHRETVFKG
jgi:putative restriction endonuclease